MKGDGQEVPESRPRCESCWRTCDARGVTRSFELSDGWKFWCSKCLDNGRAKRWAMFWMRGLMVCFQLLLLATTVSLLAGTLSPAAYLPLGAFIALMTLSLFQEMTDERIFGPLKAIRRVQKVWVCPTCELHWRRRNIFRAPKSCGNCGGPVRESLMFRRDAPSGKGDP